MYVCMYGCMYLRTYVCVYIMMMLVGYTVKCVNIRVYICNYIYIYLDIILIMFSPYPPSHFPHKLAAGLPAESAGLTSARMQSI